ncbi:MAG: hypothetical protein HRU38_07390 [Saccharospirillaceae bacterium]|nr:hypothetical protein [Pseudomonadales bacterium]NRB78475.1 hypothetical protein [Saccharospirillaceae bacterium]
MKFSILSLTLLTLTCCQSTQKTQSLLEKKQQATWHENVCHTSGEFFYDIQKLVDNDLDRTQASTQIHLLNRNDKLVIQNHKLAQSENIKNSGSAFFKGSALLQYGIEFERCRHSDLKISLLYNLDLAQQSANSCINSITNEASIYEMRNCLKELN